MPDAYDTIYISPHLDDAVLSCGGQIFQQTLLGESVLVVTVAAGEPQTAFRSLFAQFLHHNWGFTAAEAVARRRAEDLAACNHLGAEPLHWSLPDAIYRLHPQTQEALYTSNEEIFGTLNPAEKQLTLEIAAYFASLPPARRVVAPLSIGNHVDHQLVRAAAERAWGCALLYYEDFPYVQRDPRAIVQLLQPPTLWRSHLIKIDRNALEARLEAIRMYRSQLSSLFNDDEQMEAAVREQVAHTGGERLWQQVRN